MSFVVSFDFCASCVIESADPKKVRPPQYFSGISAFLFWHTNLKLKTCTMSHNTAYICICICICHKDILNKDDTTCCNRTRIYSSYWFKPKQIMWIANKAWCVNQLWVSLTPCDLLCKQAEYKHKVYLFKATETSIQSLGWFLHDFN